MIRGLLLAALALSSLTGQVFAQAIVKAGEHSDFSRLVVYLPADQDWTLEASSSGYLFSAPDWKDGFDTSQVFDKIPKTRIGAISTEPSALEIELVCDCELTAEALERGGVILDARKKAKPSIEQVVEVIPPPVERPSIALSSPISNLQGELVAEALSERPQPEEPHPDLAVFRRSLLENLGRSASLSLIELQPNRPSAPAAKSGSQSDTNISVEEFRRFEQSGRHRITSAMEAALADRSLEPEVKPVAECPLPSELSIGSWGNEQTFGDQIGPARIDILGEFDKPNIAAVRNLVRLYLHFGLGVEVISILDQFDVQPAERNLLLGMANIIEPSSTPTSNPLSDLAHCDATVAIWSALAVGTTSSLPDEQIKLIIAAFSTWPRHLRDHLGPKLVAALKSGGANGAASVVVSIIERPTGETDPELTLVSARLSDHEAYASADLLEIVNEGDDDAPEALLYYMQRLIEGGQEVSPEFVDLSFAFAKELNGIELGDALTNVSIQALLKSGDFPGSLAAYHEAVNQGWMPDDGLFDTMVEEFVAAADVDNVTRLTLFLQAESVPWTIKPENTELLIKRFVADGLPSLAAALLEELPQRTAHAPLASDVAKASDQLEDAVTFLQNLSDQESKQRLAEIMLLDGQENAVWDEMQDDLPLDLKERVAWAAARWDAVEGDGPEGDVASLMSEIPKIALGDTPLTSAQKLQEGSASSRDAITRLLGLSPS